METTLKQQRETIRAGAAALVAGARPARASNATARVDLGYLARVLDEGDPHGEDVADALAIAGEYIDAGQEAAAEAARQVGGLEPGAELEEHVGDVRGFDVNGCWPDGDGPQPGETFVADGFTWRALAHEETAVLADDEEPPTDGAGLVLEAERLDDGTDDDGCDCCDGSGWLVATPDDDPECNGAEFAVERCDTCAVFADDLEAAAAFGDEHGGVTLRVVAVLHERQAASEV